MSIKLANVVAASVLALLGLFFVASSIPIYQTRFGGGPGPGAFPLWVGLVLTVSASAYLVSSLRSTDSGPFMSAAPGEKGWLIWTGLSLLGYVALMQFLGFALTTFLFIAFQIRVIGRYGVIFSLIFSLVSAVACAYLFRVGLNMSLPTGIIGW